MESTTKNKDKLITLRYYLKQLNPDSSIPWIWFDNVHEGLLMFRKEDLVGGNKGLQSVTTIIANVPEITNINVHTTHRCYMMFRNSAGLDIASLIKEFGDIPLKYLLDHVHGHGLICETIRREGKIVVKGPLLTYPVY